MISLPFIREHETFVDSIPFSREKIYSGGYILPVFRSTKNAGISAPDSRDLNLIFEFNLLGLNGAARVDPGIRSAFGRWVSAFVGMSVSGRQIQRFFGVFIAQASRIGDCFSDPDLKGSELRALDPSHEGGKALPTKERSGVMMLLPSVIGVEPGSPDPVGDGVGGIQNSWKRRSADGSNGRDDFPTATDGRRSARKDGDLRGRASSVPGEFILPVPGFRSMPTRTKRSFGLISGSDFGEGILTIFELPKSWVPESVLHLVPTPTKTSTTVSLVMLSAGSDLAIQIHLKVFIGGRGSYRSARAPVTVTSRMTELGRHRRMGGRKCVRTLVWLLLRS